jgi:hypothetical protein
LRGLLPDNGAAIVAYCSNLQCRTSEIAADELLWMGYADVRTEGRQDWVEAGLPLEASVPA